MTTRLAPRVLVDAPAQRLNRIGTVLGSLPVATMPDDRWIAGMTFQGQPWYLNDQAGVPMRNTDVCTIVAPPVAGNTEWDGYTMLLRAEVDCTQMQLAALDRARAQRALAGIESVALGRWFARELATPSTVADEPDPFALTAPTTYNLTPLAGDKSPGAYALSALEEALGHYANGDEQVVIWTTPNVLNVWADSHLIDNTGGVLRDLLGNVIIVDRGLTAALTGPSAAALELPTADTSWAYATPVPEIVRSGDYEFLESYDAGLGSVGAANKRSMIAQRAYGIKWDRPWQVAVRVDVCSTVCSP